MPLKNPLNSHWILAIMLVISTSACAKRLAETEVVFLNLGEPLNTPSAQISGMAWCQDKLLLLPQLPEFSTSDGGDKYQLYTLEKEDIARAIADPSTLLTPAPVDFVDEPLRDNLEVFDGYEAVVCSGKRFWFAIETKVEDRDFTTTLVEASGDLTAAQPSIKLAEQPLGVIESQSGIWNFSEETLVLDGDNLLAIHEANGTIDNPYAISTDLKTSEQSHIAFPTIAHRITDATAMIDQRFWVINYLWADLDVLKGYPDKIAKQYPPNGTHLKTNSVERLLELEFRDGAIELTDTPPIYLQLSNLKGRNWEGVVRMGDAGLLLVSDEHPATIFGFVPFKPSL